MIFNFLILTTILIKVQSLKVGLNLGLRLKFADLINKFDGDVVKYNKEENMFLKDNFVPVSEEKFNIPMKVVAGAIPKDLRGLYLRIGPNGILHHDKRRFHMFDGHGMIHSVRIKDDGAYYSAQYINTFRYAIEKELDRNVFFQFGEFAGLIGLFKVLVVVPLINSYFKKTAAELGQANTALVYYNNKIYACHEASYMYEIQWQDNNIFKSIEYERFNHQLSTPINAHGKVDPVDGNLYFSSYDFNPKTPATVIGSANQSNITTYYTVNNPVKPWTHDHMITEHYFITFENSIQYSPQKLLEGEVFSFQSNHKFRIGINPKTATTEATMKWFELSSSYGFLHVSNAWEEKNEKKDEIIVIWMPLSTDFSMTGNNRNNWHMHEIRLNMNTGESTVNCIDNEDITEFPRVHPMYLGRKSKYSYASKMYNDVIYHGIVKYDHITKKQVGKIILPPNHYCGEVIPIPKNGTQGQKCDGVYLAMFVYNDITKISQYYVYDGETMNTTPVVILDIGSNRVPNGFHADWLSESQLQAHIAAHTITHQ